MPYCNLKKFLKYLNSIWLLVGGTSYFDDFTTPNNNNNQNKQHQKTPKNKQTNKQKQKNKKQK